VKLKQRAEDFRVEELSPLEAGAEGPFALYRLEKEGLGTIEAIDAIARAWRIPRKSFAFAGLKDRYGRTGQRITIRGGPKRNFESPGLRLNYLGRAERPAERGTLLGNHFRIVLRDLRPEEAERAAARARSAAAHGIPDYFDDQRFGSIRGTRGAFVARALLSGDAEKALRLAIACPSREDRSRVKRRRKFLRDRWGAWGALAELLDPSVEKRICARLAEGARFEEAYALLDPALRSIHLSAYQAHLFNEGLRRAIGGGVRHPGLDGPYVFYEGDPGPLRDERIPLASAGAEPHPLLDAALAEEGVDRGSLARLPFRRGIRGAVVVPEDLEVLPPERDELNPGRWKLALAFRLRPGSYATMLVKRCAFDFA